LNIVYIVSAARTAIGKFGGSLASKTAADLGTIAAKAALERSGVDAAKVEETICGNARQAGGGPNVGRQISFRSGVPQEVPAYTVNMACGSGLRALGNCFLEIAVGNRDVMLTVGVEAMSKIPYLLDGARWGYRLGSNEVVDAMYRDGYNCPLSNMIMGETADALAVKYGISREEQDQYALRSQQRAQAATESGRFKEEIVPITLEGKKGPTVFERDEHIFFDATIEKMAKLKPVFSKTGTVTAGNASGITDGAAALVLASEAYVKANNLKPLARIIGISSAGVDPCYMGIGPVPACQILEKKTGIKTSDYELVELNEAFASQVLACDRELHFNHEILNVNGGAISLGHPTGCTGARITVALLHELMKRKKKLGLATLCVSGGLGLALAIENCQ
jgi:acetyl-CoA C-acetyltransferase